MKPLNIFYLLIIEHKTYKKSSFFCVVPYCHLSATLQTMNIIVVNLQNNLAVVLIFIAILRFPFDSPSYDAML